MNHTPGPWHIDPHTHADKDIFLVEPGVRIDYDDVDHEEQDANAKLIVVAPELLEACVLAEQALHFTREYVGEAVLPAIEGWSWYDASQALKAVIAKVKE